VPWNRKRGKLAVPVSRLNLIVMAAPSLVATLIGQNFFSHSLLLPCSCPKHFYILPSLHTQPGLHDVSLVEQTHDRKLGMGKSYDILPRV
jgi:hypothetical protein